MSSLTEVVAIRDARDLKGLVKRNQPERIDYVTGGLIWFKYPHIILTPEMAKLGSTKAVIIDEIKILTLLHRNRNDRSLVEIKLFRLAKETLLSYKELPGWWPAEWLIF